MPNIAVRMIGLFTGVFIVPVAWRRAWAGLRLVPDRILVLEERVRDEMVREERSRQDSGWEMNIVEDYLD